MLSLPYSNLPIFKPVIQGRNVERLLTICPGPSVKRIPASVKRDALNIGMFLLRENFFTKNE